eukprot:768814-Hanusia_phi.AAC.15
MIPYPSWYPGPPADTQLPKFVSDPAPAPPRRGGPPGQWAPYAVRSLYGTARPSHTEFPAGKVRAMIVR